MAIRNAAQRGDFVYVYDEKNYQTFSIPAGSGPNDGLKGYAACAFLDLAHPLKLDGLMTIDASALALLLSRRGDVSLIAIEALPDNMPKIEAHAAQD